MQRMVFLFAFLCLLVRCTFAQTAVTSVSSSFTIGATLVLAAADTASSSPTSTLSPTHEVDDQSLTSLQSTPTNSVSSPPETTHRANDDGHKRPGTHLPNPPTDSSSQSAHHPTIYHLSPMPSFPYPTNPLADPPHDRPHHPIAPPSSPPSTSTSSPPHRTHKQPVVAIVFEVLAGIVGSFLIFTLSRCVYSWRRTPPRDRVQSLLSRHYLEREMAERERWEIEQRVLQAVPNLWRPPPPPYVTAPAYEDVVSQGDVGHAV